MREPNKTSFAEVQEHKGRGRLTRAQKRAARAERKAQKRAAKEAVLPIHKRPIICPPDKAGRGTLFRLGGLLCRLLVIWLSAAGLSVFIAGALEFGVPSLVIFLSSLLVVAVGMLLRLGAWGKLAALLTAGGAVGGCFALHPSLLTDLPYGVLSLYNAALDRLYRVGYLTYVQYKVPIATSTPHEELMVMGTCVLTVLIAVLFTACFVGRVRIVPPAVVSTVILVVLLTFNIYSNRIRSNLGIALVIVSFASMLVMAAYDRLYHSKDRRDRDRYDTEMKLFTDEDRPTLPPEYQKRREARATRKEARAKARADAIEKHKAYARKTVTVDEELSDYFGAAKKKSGREKRVKAPKLTPAERKARARERREMRRQVRAALSYDRVTEQSRSAMGGYTAGAVLLASLIAVAIPALAIKGNFNTIAAIDEKMELARNYVTALLRGDDGELDRLEYEADADNFKPHPTDLRHLEFTGKQIFYLQSRYHTSYYLRGWLGTNYEDGAWQAVSPETLTDYRTVFGKDGTPAETLRYGFYHYMKPELVDDEEYTDNLFTKYQANQLYGFINLPVSLRRVNSPSTLTYFPSVFDPRYGLMQYGTDAPHDLTFVNYYDGLYTGRNFHKNGVSYSTMTYAPVMKDARWAERQASLQAAYNLQKEALLARTGFSVNAEGEIVSYLTLTVEPMRDGTTLFMYTYKRGSTETIWRFYHDTDEVTRGKDTYTVATPYGVLTLTMNGSRVIGSNVTDVGSAYLDELGTPVDVNLVDDYDRRMTDEERAELMAFIRLDREYGDFVYRTYLDTADSEFIAALAETIRREAHVEYEIVTEELIPDDPATEEDDSYTVTHRETANRPVDVSLADVRGSSDPDAYVQRDLLVRNVIDYIIDEMGCTYTLTPDLSLVDEELDGVENFLRNTKEGYCVQFASAAALLLRELGIPTRFVEGYIGNEFTRESREDFVYGGYVRDYNAHAWIEVWFDGVGWISYETTPQYYTGLYGADSSIGIGPVDPILPDDPTDPEEETTEPVTEDEETESDEETTEEPDETTAEVLKSSLIALCVILLLGGVSAVIATMVSRARAAEDHRRSNAAHILESGYGTHTNEADRRELALEVSGDVMTLLDILGLSPRSGEFREEYADRLTAELSPEPKEGKKAAATNGKAPLPDLHLALDGMAAEEFGHGMSIPEMKAMAELYLVLHDEAKGRLTAGERFTLRYLKRKI